MESDGDFTKWADIIGTWRPGEGEAIYERGGPLNGVLLGPSTLTNGEVRVTARLLDTAEDGSEERTPTAAAEEDVKLGDGGAEYQPVVPGARIVFGYDLRDLQAYSAGIGHAFTHYVIERLAPAVGPGWNPVGFAGMAAQLEPGRDYEIELQLLGQRALLKVDAIPVIDITLPAVPTGKQIGIMAWGPQPVKFTNFMVEERAPRLFVVMQFGPPLDSIYTEVIAPVGAAAGFEPRRADDFVGPGQILADITRELREASVVVAEISEANPNVYYEIGYAHAVGTPTILAPPCSGWVRR